MYVCAVCVCVCGVCVWCVCGVCVCVRWVCSVCVWWWWGGGWWMIWWLYPFAEMPVYSQSKPASFSGHCIAITFVHLLFNKLTQQYTCTCTSKRTKLHCWDNHHDTCTHSRALLRSGVAPGWLPRPTISCVLPSSLVTNKTSCKDRTNTAYSSQLDQFDTPVEIEDSWN